jgi:hypothetical protein
MASATSGLGGGWSLIFLTNSTGLDFGCPFGCFPFLLLHYFCCFSKIYNALILTQQPGSKLIVIQNKQFSENLKFWIFAVLSFILRQLCVLAGLIR